MSKTLLRAEALAALVLNELRRSYAVACVRIQWCRTIHPITGAHWAPTALDAPASDAAACHRELWRVCQRLGSQYELAP
jgi:hypothetical protein